MSKKLTPVQIREKINGLQVGASFRVQTDNDRTYALNQARAIAKRIVTRKTKSGGFTITALPAE